MPGERSFAEDERAQALAREIQTAQNRADAELENLRHSRSPKLKVGDAMQHALWQGRADKARRELIEHTGLEV